MNFIQFIKKHKLILGLILLGISIRLFFIFSFNHVFDFFNILVITKSEAETNSALNAFFIIKNASNHETQLFGKLYYQFLGLWLYILQNLHILNIKYIFDYQSYSGSGGYMGGFGQWGPLHYQLVAIKMIQFVFEGIFLYFFLSVIKLLKKNSYKYLVAGTFFWAINLFMIYPTYVPFQSDLAMTSFLMAGIYFALKSWRTEKNSQYVLYIVLMTLSFSVGAIIKQVPLLFVLPLLIVISKNIKSFIIGLFSFGGWYYLISEPWSTDAQLYKSFFFSSPESTALFRFNLNGASIFMMLYVVFIVGTIIYRNYIKQDPWNLIKLSVILLAIVYISEDLSFLYAQFNLWIMPFLFLMMLKDKTYGLFFLAPIVGFYRWAIIDNGTMTGSLWVTYGRPLADIPSFEYILKQIIAPPLINTAFNSVFIITYVLMIVYTLTKSFKIPFLEYISLKRVILTIFFIYVAFFSFDFYYRGGHVLLTNIQYHETSDQVLTTEPIKIKAFNPEKKHITGLEIALSRGTIQQVDSILLEIKNREGKLIERKKLSDFEVPMGFGDFFIPFNKTISEPAFDMYVSKVHGYNNIKIRTASKYSIPTYVNQNYMDYDAYYKTNRLRIEFPETIFAVNLRGSYALSNMFNNVQMHMSQKPLFYLLFFTLFGISSIGGAILITASFREKKEISI